MATIGISQRIPLSLLEMALHAVLSREYSRQYFAELAAMEYNGANRIQKSVTVISKLTDKNPLINFLREYREEVIEAMRYQCDRGIILSAMLIASYEFVYDLMCLYGKYFHVQDQVPTSLIAGKLSHKYGSNRSLPNAMNSAVPMLLEAGLLKRPSIGIYEIGRCTLTTDIARKSFDYAFLHWNPNCDLEVVRSAHPFYEYIN